jgi:Fe-S-cluster containining protein
LPRVPTHIYADPLDRIWLTTAARVGLTVRRTKDAYASTPGDGHLLLGDSPHLDPDDSLAQMIFHELCHSLVQGEESFRKRDWGLDNETLRDVAREEACLRVQATLSARHGLRRFFAPTTDFRAFYDALPDDALAPRGDLTIALAISGIRRAESPPWAPHLSLALEATRGIAAHAAAFTTDVTTELGLADLWSRVDAVPNRHPSGLPGAAFADGHRTCGTCAWRSVARSKCRQAGVRVHAEWPACERWERALDCQACGACCRAAYDCVQVSPRDPVRKKHPSLVVVRGPYLEIERQGDRCAALGGGAVERMSDGAATFTPYVCSIYQDRPRSCRHFENGGEHCLTARRRVGMSL